jgi:RNA recognition motif-containing protein
MHGGRMSKKVYVGNLPFSYGFEKLKEFFSKFGEIEEATVITDKYSGRSKGFGFVVFANDGDADKAIAEMNGKETEGRALKVSEATPFDPENKPKKEFRPRRNFGNRNRRDF